MRLKTTLSLVIPLALVLVLGVSCQRTADPSPSPFGPSGAHLTLDLEAYPNVIYVTSAGRATSQVTATVKNSDASLPGAMIIFTITDGDGEFTNYQRRITATTDSNGVATATFVSPSLAEFNRDYYATVEAQVQTDSPYYLWKDIQIRVMKPKT